MTEIFLYNNDDYFFFDYIKEEDIYSIIDGKIKLKVINNLNIDKIKTKTTEYSKRIIKTAEILNSFGYNINDLINNHITKILRKSTMKIIEIKYKNLLDNLRSYKFRNYDSIQYLFFVINIDNNLHNNIIIKPKNNCIEYQFRNKDYDKNDQNITKKFTYRKIKFICFNDMNDSYKDVFVNLMNLILNNISNTK